LGYIHSLAVGKSYLEAFCFTEGLGLPQLPVNPIFRTVALERIWKWGHRFGAKCQKKIFCRAPPLFWL